MKSTLPFALDPVVDDHLKSANGDRLRLVPGDQNWVIRFIGPRQYEVYPELLAQTRSVHDGLGDFGIRLPPRAYVEVEEQPGAGRTMLVIAARVAGESLLSAVVKSDEARRAAEAVVTDTLRYYAHHFVARTPYFSDVHIGQFMWGTHLHSPTPGAVDDRPGRRGKPSAGRSRRTADRTAALVDRRNCKFGYRDRVAYRETTS